MSKNIVCQEEKFGEDLGPILTQERKAHYKFFGQEFDLARFRRSLENYGPKKISYWQKLGLEPHFLPPVVMHRNINFPGWKVKPDKQYYEQVAEGKVLRRQPDGQLKVDLDAFKLEGIIVLVDTRLKPDFNGKQMFKRDNLLGPIIKRLRQKGKIAYYKYDSLPPRFGVSVEDWKNQIKSILAKFLGMEVYQVRLERTIEANVIPQLYRHMPRYRDNETNTSVWYEEYYKDVFSRFLGGSFGMGGLAYVDYLFTNSRWPARAFRPLILIGH